MSEEKTSTKTGIIMQNHEDTSRRNSGSVPKDMPRPKHAVFVDKLEVKAREQKRIPLGSFVEETQPKGFLVEVDPDPSPSNAVTTEITSLGSGSRYTLYLLISNFSSKMVHADIWRI